MKYYKERSVIKHNADPAEAELSLGSDIVVGKFRDVEKPTFLDMQKENILDVVSARIGGKK